jgi:GTPase Era involved in 16S rRNA processing
MWWIPVAFVGGYLVKKLIDNNVQVYTVPLTTLERNMVRLSSSLEQLTDKKKIAVLGQAGAGKSTLIDKLTLSQCSPRPSIGQKTDATNWSNIIIDDFWYSYQDFVFVDVPGYDTSNHPTESYIDCFPFQKFDCIIFMIKGKVRESDNKIWKTLASNALLLEKTQIVRSFAENLTPEEIDEIIKDLNLHFEKKPIVMSNRNETGFDEIRKYLQIPIGSKSVYYAV